MSFAAIPFPTIDPVALSLGPIEIKWYGLAYLTGLVLGWLYIRNLLANKRLWANAQPPFGLAKTDDLLIWMTLGVVVGGRLGFVLFYDLFDYLQNPLEIFMVWRGGMAFHGALLGCGLAIWGFARFAGVNAWSTMDLCAAAVPIGLFFGRIANFVNGELWGRVTEMPWGMVFPEATRWNPIVGAVGRHPSQLYEAALEGLLLFVVLRVLTHRKLALQTPGLVTGVFLVGYGLTRSFCELFRQYDPAHWLSVEPLTPGIVYSVPMVLLGLAFIAHARRRVIA